MFCPLVTSHVSQGDHCMYLIAYVNVDIHISYNKDLDRNKNFVDIYLSFDFLIPEI